MKKVEVFGNCVKTDGGVKMVVEKTLNRKYACFAAFFNQKNEGCSIPCRKGGVEVHPPKAGRASKVQ